MTDTTNCAAIYTRVSTDEQANNFSLDSQVSYCRDYIGKQGYSLAHEAFLEEFTGTVMDRPELDKLRALAQAGQIDVIVCLELDRLGRGLVIPFLIESEFKKLGVIVEYVQEVYEDTPEGALKKGMRATISEYERLKLMERTKRGRTQKAKDKNVMAACVDKYGYEKVKEGNKTLYRPVPDEAAVILSIFTLYAVGDERGKQLKRSQIARRLSSMGVPTRLDKLGGKYAKKKKARPGWWSPRRILQILRDETYAGVAYAGRVRMVEKDGKKRPVAQDKSTWIPIEVPAIVPRDLWQAAQYQLDLNRHDPTVNSRNNTKSLFLMRSRLRCVRCGKLLHFNSIGLQYVCMGARRSEMINDEAICHGSYPQRRIDAEIWQKFCEFLQDPDMIEESYRRDQTDTERANAPVRSRLEDVTRFLAERIAERDALLDEHLKKLFPPDVLASRANPLNESIKEFEHEKADLEAHIVVPRLDESSKATLLEYSKQIRAGASHLTEEEKRDLIERFDIRGLVMRDGNNYCIELSGIIPHNLTLNGQVRGMLA